MTKHHCQDLITLFNGLFEQSENTVLVGYAEEPLYLPADEKSPCHRVIFTRDYFASALHEIAHWRIASEKRRALVDYGYWYYPEGRTAEQQELFEQVEAKPQALEYIFAQAAGSPFFVSQDNLATGYGATPEQFAKHIEAQVQHFLEHGLPARAEIFKNALLNHYADCVLSLA